VSRVLVLGGTGMLGHELWRQCAGREGAFATVRGPSSDDSRVIGEVSAEGSGSIERALAEAEPDVVVNCIGIVKQSDMAANATVAVSVNSLLPHRLAEACAERRIRLIHISTDCVYSGRRGLYKETDLADPIDLYGRSKLAGEPAGERVLTLRTSMIGWELATSNGLLEWVVAQNGRSVQGYDRAVFSGPTAPELSRLVLSIADEHPQLAGTLHVAATPISKHDLILKLRDALDLDLEVQRTPDPRIDRSLDPSLLNEKTGWRAASWDELVAELASIRPVR
jgi:dTDP-4-dehydrorhamnose reductase